MSLISIKDKHSFLTLYNRNGYVLDFSTDNFDRFTLKNVGVELCKKYKMSKGKSLESFADEENEEIVIKLFVDLFDYYEAKSIYKMDRENSYELFLKYNELKKIIDKYRNMINKSTNESLVLPIKFNFNSEYITKQIDYMMLSQKDNPTEAIGKAKELIESCCIAILDDLKKEYDKKSDIYKLVKLTTDSLELTPNQINDNLPLSKTIKSILQSLKSIAGGVAELRNQYGSGHGKSPNFKGLQERHAKLAIGSAATLVNFLWDSYIRMQAKINLDD